MHHQIKLLFAAAIVTMLTAASVWAQGDAKAIFAKKPAELIAMLQNPNATVFEKAKACQRLAVVGSDEAVPALASLLSDEKLNEYARFGLEGIASPAGDAALCEAAPKLQGRPLVGVLDSIGQRKDAKAVGLLKTFLSSQDAAAASAAAGALGRIGNAEAADVLLASLAQNAAVKQAIADGALACADALTQKGDKATADKLYVAILAAQDLPKYVQVAAIRGQLRLDLPEAKDILLKQITSADKDFFNAGLAAARTASGAEVTAALAAAVEKLPPERQALLLLAIGDRKDAAPAALFAAAAKSPAAAVREAAVRVFIHRGEASAANVLLDAAMTDDAVATIAKDGLAGLPGKDVDAAILARWPNADARAKAMLLGVMGARQIADAVPTIRQAMADADPAVRQAALAAMSQVADMINVDILIEKAVANNADAQEVAAAKAALLAAVQRMSDRDGCAAKLASHIAGQPATNQAYLYELLGKVSGKKALEIVVAAAKSSDPATKDAATRVLGEWVNTDAAPALLEIAKTDADAKYQVRALRGYIRIARQLEIPWWEKTNNQATKLDMFREAMQTAKRADEKRLALDILTRIPSAETLKIAASYVDEAGLRDAAANSAVKIAEKMTGAGDRQRVAAAMTAVAISGAAGKSGERARQLLAQADGAAAAAVNDEKSFTTLFDGKTFDGWEGDLKVFRIEQGAIVGGNLQERGKQNEFLTFKKPFGDFELRFKCKLLGENPNGGMQFRSQRVPNSREMCGYQADMASGYWGCIYDESRRAKVLAGLPKAAQDKIVNLHGWNNYVVRAEGRHIQLWINGQKTADYTEKDAAIPQTGLIGVQVHGGLVCEAWYKDIRIKELSAK